MIKLKHTEVVGWEAAIRGMRNPMNSWEKSDSFICDCDCASCSMHGDVQTDRTSCLVFACRGDFVIGPNDRDLMMRLRNAGTDHRKFMRMIVVYMDITAPLYWWKEFDTYKVGTVANSCSTMHKVHEKEFILEDFSCEHLIQDWGNLDRRDSIILPCTPMQHLQRVIACLNVSRKKYLETKDKKYWWQMIQLLPSSYNQRRTVMLNYEVLANIYKSRKGHKLDEWREFCQWIESLPYSEIITGPDISQIPISNEIMEEAKRRVFQEFADTWNRIPEASFPVHEFLNKELNVPIDSSADNVMKATCETGQAMVEGLKKGLDPAERTTDTAKAIKDIMDKLNEKE